MCRVELRWTQWTVVSAATAFPLPSGTGLRQLLKSRAGQDRGKQFLRVFLWRCLVAESKWMAAEPWDGASGARKDWTCTKHGGAWSFSGNQRLNCHIWQSQLEYSKTSTIPITMRVRSLYFILLWLLPQIWVVIGQQMWDGRRPRRRTKTNRVWVTWKLKLFKLEHEICCFIVQDEAGVAWKHVAVHLFDEVKPRLFFFFLWWIKISKSQRPDCMRLLCVKWSSPCSSFKAKHTILSPPFLVFSILRHPHLFSLHWRAPNRAQPSRCSQISAKQKAIIAENAGLKLYGNKTRESLLC